MNVGDLIRGTYPDCSFRTVYLGIITDHDGDWLEITTFKYLKHGDDR